MINLNKIMTENRNPKTMHLDKMSSLEIATVMNQEDQKASKSVGNVLKPIAKLIDLAYETIFHNGRVIYLGAGTSGRLGVLDASECPPTFGVSPDVFIGVIAGGNKALTTAVEGAEDSKELAVKNLKSIKLNKKDLLIGLAASGRTPYVIGGLEYANKIGCKTGSIACSKNAEISKLANIAIEVMPGPEVLTGSTRLKAGTTQKLILNMISTGAMIKMGKCYQNLMVDVVPTNKKLHIRAENIVMMATGVDRVNAIKTLKQCNYHAKTAVVMILNKCNKKEATNKLVKANGHIKNTLRRK
ncbi:MAG: N-acetylmuramic acid 6-phosphate etherase [Bacilli bacterium]|nr:N-acetylmuramic acid 6-phosphate etherase [Bacilli bacterium]